ncbi:hypothetical protein RCCWILLIS_14 [Rhodobacter phage RcCWillis]|nr:hypothetical protein RCCWILLIS_14 [Rhodobacter phage RcCWillis]
MDKILFTGGSSLVISGQWKSGDPFTGSTTISATVEFGGKTPAPAFACTVTLDGERDFEIYAAAAATATWPKGIHTIRLARSDAGYFGNGDPLVEVLEPFQIEVR